MGGHTRGVRIPVPCYRRSLRGVLCQILPVVSERRPLSYAHCPVLLHVGLILGAQRLSLLSGKRRPHVNVPSFLQCVRQNGCGRCCGGPPQARVSPRAAERSRVVWAPAKT